MNATPSLYLGVGRPLDGSGASTPHQLPARHLVTHGVVVGMTGSGKTGLVTVAVEEAARAGVPVLVIDVKGDLPNLLLAFPDFEPARVAPWVEDPDHDEAADAALAAKLAKEREQGLASFGLGAAELADYRARTFVRVITPGADAGELLHVLSALERCSHRWDDDVEGARPSSPAAAGAERTSLRTEGSRAGLDEARTALSAAVSLILRLLGRDPDPARSREHVLLSVLAERRLVAGDAADIGALLPEVIDPPMPTIGALPVDAFLSKRMRKELASALNSLLAAPTFASWRQGVTLDIGAWLKKEERPDGPARTPITVLSVAHLDDDERALVLGVVLEEVLSWVRGLPGSQRLKALIVFDEVYGFLPPHPAAPPTKRPLVALMKQARAYGVGVVIATQNPMDLDYRALSNAGLWCLGRLQTDADRDRVLDGLCNEAAAGDSKAELGDVLKRLRPRWFVVRDAQDGGATRLLEPRWAYSFMRGPMTRGEIRKARG